VLGCALALASGTMAADAAKGKKVFNKCKACHSLKAGKKKIGPDLAKLFGRKAGTVKKFRYSKALKKSGVVWDEKSLDAFLAKPRKFVKGTKMSFPGLKKKADRDNLIAFLKEATK
jgi:cytochrome c